MICVMRAGRGRVGVLDDLRGAGKGTKPWSQSKCQIKAHDTVMAAAMVAVLKGGCYTKHMPNQST